jgi:DNA-binding response OmpR family regulator
MSARLLVVDDQTAVAQALATRLQEEGFAVDVAHDGEEGFEKLMAADYDLVVTDVAMPIMDGTEMLTKAQDAKGKLFRSIVIGGYAPDARPAGLEHAQWMTRPVAMGDLLAAVRGQLA